MFKKPIKFCCPTDIKPINDYVDEYDYGTPIKRFSKEQDFDFKLESNLDYDEIKKNRLILPQSKQNDIIMNYYIKSSKDISIILIYPSALKHKKKLELVINELKSNGNIYYMKTIELDFIMCYNLIYQLYYNEYRMKDVYNINYKCNRIGFEYEQVGKKELMVIVYHHKNKQNQISGNSSEFKNYLRNFFLEEDIKTTKYSPDDDNYPRLYDYLHIGNNDSQSYDYAGILFNENSIKFLSKQYSWKIHKWIQSINKFNTIKEFLYKYSQKEIECFLIMSSGVLFSHGIREMNDVDALMTKTIISSELINKMNKENEKVFDISYPGVSTEWDNELNARAKSIGANNFIELILNPKYHYYFMGIKFLRLKYEVITRFKRGRPAQLTDLIVMRQMYNFKYDLEIPKTKTEYNKELKKDITKNLSETELLNTVKFYLDSRYKIKLNINQIKEWILNFKPDKTDSTESDSDIKYEKNKKGGSIFSNKYVDSNIDISNEKYVYPQIDEIIKMGYLPNVIIYGDNYPFLYPAENYNDDYKMCELNLKDININNRLSVMSFNVHNFISRCNQGNAPVFSKRINPFDKPRDINKFIELFKKYSPTVLCLQEVVPILNQPINEKLITDFKFIRNNFNFEYLNKLMESIGYKYKIIANTKKGNRLKGEEPKYFFLSNAIYSKVPILNHNIIQFKFTDRNFIDIEIEYNKMKINIINLHFEYFNGVSLNVPEIKDITLMQYNILNEYVNKLNNKNIILCGDFNINLFEQIQNNKRYNINYSDKVKLITEYFNNTSKINIPTNFIQNTTTDYILFSKTSKIKPFLTQILKTNISDHYPVISYFS